MAAKLRSFSCQPLRKWAMIGKHMKKPMKLLYNFSGNRIEPIDVITLPVSFGTPQNPRTEYITFNVVDMHYSYITILGRELLNTFEAALYSRYICLRCQPPSESYPSLEVRRTPETLNGASCLAIRTFTS
jgi:hypothetical protein